MRSAINVSLIVFFIAENDINQRFFLKSNGESKCACLLTTCNCPNVTTSDFINRSLTKDDRVIDIVAREICHDPRDLFNYIRLTHSDYYQNISPLANEDDLKNKFAKCLRTWIETQGEDADLKTLVGGLCQAKFHDINEKLKNYY